MAMTAEEVTEAVFSLFERGGNAGYIGEMVTQLEHATQCGMLAEQDGHPPTVILGAFLHDVGHLIGGQTSMITDGVTLGNKGHETIGAEFLRKLGVPEEVASLGRWHVAAKRYLCFKDENYLKNLSPASNQTLQHQGGPMTAEEAECFDQLTNKEVILLCRTWDEKAKVANMTGMPSIAHYRQMFKEYISNVLH